MTPPSPLPQSAILHSPWVQLIPGAASYKFHGPLDTITENWVEPSAAHYVGGDANVRVGESWNPFRAFLPSAKPLKDLVGKELTPLEEGEEAEGLKVLRSPFVNPAMVRDLEWWREACPPEGRTFVSWGELFSSSFFVLASR